MWIQKISHSAVRKFFVINVKNLLAVDKMYVSDSIFVLLVNRFWIESVTVSHLNKRLLQKGASFPLELGPIFVFIFSVLTSFFYNTCQFYKTGVIVWHSSLFPASYLLWETIQSVISNRTFSRENVKVFRVNV